MYWIYETHIYFWRNQYVQAKLVEPPARALRDVYGGQGFRSPAQDERYGADLALTYQINPKHPFPDNYFESAGFRLFSGRLVDVMLSFGVKAEVFAVTMVGKKREVILGLNYSVFHSLEGVLPAMDEEKSGWSGDLDVGLPRLVLDENKFEHRPIFLCDHIFVPLMRDDVKQEIEQRNITGFRFLAPELYRSGSYGFPPKLED